MKIKMTDELVQLAMYCLSTLLYDDTKKSVIGFAKPLSNVKMRAKATRAKHHTHVMVTIGKPNYAEREYLKLCKKAKTQPKKIFKFFK